MSSELKIPTDIGEHCRRVADFLDQACSDLDRNLSLWLDPDDPDWWVQFEHGEIERLRKNLGEVEKFIDFLAQHGGCSRSEA